MHSVQDIEAPFVHQTERGFCVKNLKGKEVWIPKSKIEVMGTDHIKGQLVKLQMEEWLAIEKELI